jgi:hypothetical protein
VPANDGRRDLIAKREEEHRRVTAELADLLENCAADVAAERAIVQERHVLGPWQSHHHPQAVTGCFVEQTGPGRRVQPHGVDAELGHQAEVLRGLPGRWILMALGVRGEGAVGHALDEESLVSQTQELPVGGRVMGRRWRREAARYGIGLESNAHVLLSQLPALGSELLFYQGFGVVIRRAGEAAPGPLAARPGHRPTLSEDFMTMA